MKAKTAKALVRAALNLKRKHATLNPKPTNTVVKRIRLGECGNKIKVVKRIKLGGYRNKLANYAGPHNGKSLIKHFLSYKKSGRPKRLMFYRNGEWVDFPNDVLDLVRKEFEIKKAVVEVELNGNHMVLNFLHMYKLDMKSGLQQPLAWIDEAGGCFFPEVFGDYYEEPYDLCKQEAGKSKRSYDDNEVKLRLKIEIDGVDQSKLREVTGESNA